MNWTFKLLMRAGETSNSLNACNNYVIINQINTSFHHLLNALLVLWAVVNQCVVSR